jgi:hypothetical protein
MTLNAQEHERNQIAKVTDLGKQLVGLNNFNYNINKQRTELIGESKKDTSPLRDIKPLPDARN